MKVVAAMVLSIITVTMITVIILTFRHYRHKPPPPTFTETKSTNYWTVSSNTFEFHGTPKDNP